MRSTTKIQPALAALFGIALAGCAGGGDPAPAPAPIAATPTPPLIRSFGVDVPAVRRDEAVTLLAVFEGGAGVITPGVGPVASGVPAQVNPTGDTVYRLIVTAPDGALVSETVAVLEFDHLVTTADDAGPGSLRQAMLETERAGDGEIGIAVTSVLLDAPLPVVRGSMRISGAVDGATVDGRGLQRLFFKDGPGTLEITDLVLRAGRATGGAGGSTRRGGTGGGGAGLGGALFVNGGVVSIARVRFEDNAAIGGGGGGLGGSFAGGGGGGVGGPGASASDFRSGAGGDGGPLGGLGGLGGDPGQPGGEGAGGGGADAGATAGAGGFGGGGGGAGNSSTSRAGDGGFGGGGGGGSSNPGGRGGFAGGRSGYGYAANGGGGGGGLGGAVFVRTGFLELVDVAFQGSRADGGAGGTTDGYEGQAGQPGLGKGAAVFVAAGAVAFGTRVTFNGSSSSDDLGIPGDDEDVYGLLDLD